MLTIEVMLRSSPLMIPVRKALTRKVVISNMDRQDSPTRQITRGGNHTGTSGRFTRRNRVISVPLRGPRWA